METQSWCKSHSFDLYVVIQRYLIVINSLSLQLFSLLKLGCALYTDTYFEVDFRDAHHTREITVIDERDEYLTAQEHQMGYSARKCLLNISTQHQRK